MSGERWELQSSDLFSYNKDPPYAPNEEVAVLLIHTNLKFGKASYLKIMLDLSAVTATAYNIWLPWSSF